MKTQAFAQFITERISLPELLLKNVSSIGGDHYGTVFGVCMYCVHAAFIRLLDCVYFDECLDAKLNRYALRRYNLSGGHIETPFIDNRATKHVKTFVPPPPDIQDLPTTDDGESVNYVYESFPRMRYAIESEEEMCYAKRLG